MARRPGVHSAGYGQPLYSKCTLCGVTLNPIGKRHHTPEACQERAKELELSRDGWYPVPREHMSRLVRLGLTIRHAGKVRALRSIINILTEGMGHTDQELVDYHRIIVPPKYT